MNCPICEREPETITHTLWTYPATLDVWVEEENPLQKWVCNEMQIGELWAKLYQTLDKEEIKLVIIIMRLIWLQGNSWVFDAKFEHSKSLISHAKHFLEEFTTAQLKSQVSGVQNQAVIADAI